MNHFLDKYVDSIFENSQSNVTTHNFTNNKLFSIDPVHKKPHIVPSAPSIPSVISSALYSHVSAFSVSPIECIIYNSDDHLKFAQCISKDAKILAITTPEEKNKNTSTVIYVTEKEIMKYESHKINKTLIEKIKHIKMKTPHVVIEQEHEMQQSREREKEQEHEKQRLIYMCKKETPEKLADIKGVKYEKNISEYKRITGNYPFENDKAVPKFLSDNKICFSDMFNFLDYENLYDEKDLGEHFSPKRCVVLQNHQQYYTVSDDIYTIISFQEYIKIANCKPDDIIIKNKFGNKVYPRESKESKSDFSHIELFVHLLLGRKLRIIEYHKIGINKGSADLINILKIFVGFYRSLFYDAYLVDFFLEGDVVIKLSNCDTKKFQTYMNIYSENNAQKLLKFLRKIK